MPDFGGRGYRFYYEQRHGKPSSPRATYSLLGAMGATFVLQLFVRGFFGDAWHNYLFVIGNDWYFRPWSLFTSTLAHDPTGLSHLFVNGLFLYFFGPTIENVVKWRRYVALFFATGAISGVLQVAIVRYLEGGAPGALGASGALMGLFGVTVILLPRSKMFIFPLFVPIPMWLAGIFFVLLDLIGAFTPGSLVGNFAHLAGLAIGIAYGLEIRRALRRRGLRLVVN